MLNIDKQIRNSNDKTLYWNKQQLQQIKNHMYLNGFNLKEYEVENGVKYLNKLHYICTK